jgi:uroporphyrinogen decarboxylase
MKICHFLCNENPKLGVILMNSRQKVNEIFNRKSNWEGAMWTGHPNEKTVPIFAKEWVIEPTCEAIFNYLNDDCRWIVAGSGYNHPEGKEMFDPSYGVVKSRNLGSAGCFAETENISEVDSYPWPDVKYLDFTDTYNKIEKYPDKMVFTGMWSPFFHNLCDSMGMENFFVALYERPKIVESIINHLVDFYVAANEKFFEGLGDRADVMFFGNDFGTQLNLFLAPEQFRKFLLPSFKRLVAVGKKYNKKVLLHSCGSIYKIIPDLIDAGVDALHPIQAKAAGMSANELAQFKNDIAFVGGIDAQSIFVNGTPQQIKDEVKRVREILGPNIVISPSHEEILPNVPAANILAMAQEAKNNYLNL